LIAYHVSSCGNALVDVVLLSMAFDPSDANSTGPFGKHSRTKMRPKITIVRKFPGSPFLGINALGNALDKLIGFIHKGSAIRANVHWAFRAYGNDAGS